MSKYSKLSILEIHEKLVKREITVLDLVIDTFEAIRESSNLNAFITLNEEAALEEAAHLTDIDEDDLLYGIPIAVKDNICTKGLRTTCASHMLDSFVPIYDATVVEQIKKHHMVIVGKTNMDEFAMGSTSRTSYFGAPLNPWNPDRISGGSSGGSAVSVAAGVVPFALGSDTGGSIRQPGSYCAVVGMKPTYGRVSRYGLIAFASSLDQIGPMSRNVYENALLLNALVGYDEHDLTSAKKDEEDFTRLIGKDIKGMKIAIPNYFVSDIVNPEILENLNQVVDLLKSCGAEVSYIDIDYLEQAVTLYQIIAMGEASSNLARFDGLRYGYSHPNSTSLEELYAKTRAEGFGSEVKRRIMVGSYLLSGENAVKYYDKAMKIRQSMRDSFLQAFQQYDLIIGPTTTTVAYSQSESLDDPRKSFMDDVLVIPVNMAGLPGLNLPIGFDHDHMPIGMHIIGNDFEEAKIYQLASFIEKKLNLDLDSKGGQHHE